MTTTWSQESYISALRYAAEAHKKDKWGTTGLPYLVHLVLVASEVMAAISVEGADNPDLAIQCALLHDVVEDTDHKAEQLAECFGADVAAGLAALTKKEGLAKPKAMADSLKRIREQPREIWMVKMADRISNLQPAPEHWDSAKKTCYRDEARGILEALGEASAFLAARLQSKIDKYEVS